MYKWQEETRFSPKVGFIDTIHLAPNGFGYYKTWHMKTILQMKYATIEEEEDEEVEGGGSLFVEDIS